MDPDLPREYRQNRFILDYSVQAPAALRYDTDHDKIIFDHLMYMRSDYKEQKVMKVPDGTYSGFEIIPEMEKVVFVEKVFHQRSEEHTSELQSRGHLVCRLLLDKKNST